MAWIREITWSPQIRTLAGISRRVGTGDPTFSTTQANTNTYSAASAITAETYGRVFSTAATQFRAAFWLFLTAGPASSDRPYLAYLTITGGTGDMSVIWDQGTGQIVFRLASSDVASVSVPTGLSELNTWVNLAFTYTAGTSTGTFTFYLNGAEILSYTGNLGTSCLAFYGPGRNGSTDTWGATFYLDDFYIDIGSGNPEAAPPTRRFLFALPSGAGTDTDWAPNTGANYAAVDEATLDNDSTYVAASSSDLRDNYAFADVTLPSGWSISQVIVGAIAKKTSSIDADLIFETLLNGDYGSSSAIELTTAYAYYEAQFPTDPDTGGAWTLTNANNALYGYKSSGSFA